MEKNQSHQQAPDSPEFWENEIKYFEDAMRGLNTAYAILARLKQNAEEKHATLIEPHDVG